jgi:pyruvate/2-oxoglutarate dehydrogenase complex dihydrolipoamide acyltransferase (E2) component
MKKSLPALLAVIAVFAAAPATAAMYRCGNAFQDRPCEDSSQQQTIRPGRGAGAAPAASAPAPAARPAPKAAQPASAAKP